MSKKVITRFAPSSTGALHAGGIRTGLFSYFYALKHGGECLFRLEDTDEDRYVEGSAEHIIESFRALGVFFTDVEYIGPFEDKKVYPHIKNIQSKNTHYWSYVKNLLEKGFAYYAFDTKEDLEIMRQNMKISGDISAKYDRNTRLRMKNSLVLDKHQVDELLVSKQPFVIRFKTPDVPINVIINDEIRGKVKVNSDTIDDKVLFKSSGLPAYHLANIVDDHISGVTHVIRGEEWLPSAACHCLLYDAFGWDRPVFAHLPLVLKPNGKGKLSKRDGKSLGFPVYVLPFYDETNKDLYAGFIEKGFLSAAIINYLMLLGWSPGGNLETFDKQYIIDNFDLKKINKAGAKFDHKKLLWINKHWLLKMSTAYLLDYTRNNTTYKFSDTYFEKAKNIVINSCSTLLEFLKELKVFFITHDKFETRAEEKLKEYFNFEYFNFFNTLELPDIEFETVDRLSKYFESEVLKTTLELSKCRMLFRILTTGKYTGPHLFDILQTLGKNATNHRLKYSLNLTENNKLIKEANI